MSTMTSSVETEPFYWKCCLEVAGILVIKRVARFPRAFHTTYECWLYAELHLNLTSNESAHFIAILTDTKHPSKR